MLSYSQETMIKKDTVDFPVDKISLAKKKKSFLNKFLTKTYHMIDQCDPSVASWSYGGESFTIFDVDAFEKLNFYGFQKMRSDPDLQVHTSAVRFSHEYFKKGYPELLHKITRATAGAKQAEAVQSDQVETLQNRVASLQAQMKRLEAQMDEKVGEAVRVLNDNYVARIKRLEATYESALQRIVQSYSQPLRTASPLSIIPLQPWQKQGVAEYIRSTHAP